MGVIKCFNTQCSYFDRGQPDHCNHVFGRIGDCRNARIKHEHRHRNLDFYLQELEREECACGRPKKKRKSFCYGCFLALPKGLQIDLYSRIGADYEEAYEASIKFLEEVGRIEA